MPPNSYVIDLRHYLDDKGEIPPLPAPAMAIAFFCGAVVAWVSGWPGPEGELTNVPCRRSRARKPCWGEVYARLTSLDEIEWQCAACGEAGVISGWRGTTRDARLAVWGIDRQLKNAYNYRFRQEPA